MAEIRTLCHQVHTHAHAHDIAFFSTCTALMRITLCWRVSSSCMWNEDPHRRKKTRDENPLPRRGSMHAHERCLHRELAAQGPDVHGTHGAHHWELRRTEGQLATGVAQGRAAEAAACTTHKSTNTAQAHRDALLHSHDKHTSCTQYSAPSAFAKEPPFFSYKAIQSTSFMAWGALSL